VLFNHLSDKVTLVVHGQVVHDINILRAYCVLVNKLKSVIIVKHVIQERVQDHGEQSGHGLTQNFSHR
jgi:hypothetical protein